MENMPIYSVVAYSGTGKTTLIEKLIPELKVRGLRIAVLKHDAHDFDIDHKGKDSWRMTNAGADITLIASNTKAALIENRPVSFESLLSKITDVDILLTEGYKHGSWKKIAVYRQASNKPLSLRPEECFAIMSDISFHEHPQCLDINDVSGLAELIIKDLQKRLEESL